MPEIRELLDEAPSLISLTGGDLAEQAELSLVRRICGDQLAMKESIKQKLQQLRLELAGPNPTPIERILVERMVACWLHVQFADSQLIHGGHSAPQSSCVRLFSCLRLFSNRPTTVH